MLLTRSICSSWLLLFQFGYQSKYGICCGFPQLLILGTTCKVYFNCWYNYIHQCMGYVVETHKLHYCPTGHYPCHHPGIIGTKPCAFYWRSLYCHFCTLLSGNSPVNTLQNLKSYFYLITFSCFHMEPPTVSSENKASPYNQHSACSTLILLSPSGIRDGLSEVGSLGIAMIIKGIFNTQWYLIFFLPAKTDSERPPSIRGCPTPWQIWYSGKKNQLKLIQAAGSFPMKSIFLVQLACWPPRTGNIYYLVFTLGYSLSFWNYWKLDMSTIFSVVFENYLQMTGRHLVASYICLESFPIKEFRHWENFSCICLVKRSSWPKAVQQSSTKISGTIELRKINKDQQKA